MRSLISAVLILLVCGCATKPLVSVDRNPNADLRAFKTFGFFEHPGTDPAGYSSIMTARLRAVTRVQLESLGYAYDERAPQLQVNFLLKVADRQEIRSIPGALRAPRIGGSIETVDYKAGVLAIYLVDAGSHSVVWQAIAEGRIGRADIEQPGPAVDRVVAEMLQRLPPLGSGSAS
jgi:hypothetical protein